MDEDEILHWLLSHLENEEIEDIDEDTLDRMVKEGRTMAVLFCKTLIDFVIIPLDCTIFLSRRQQRQEIRRCAQ